jgi:hypothetical protein
MAKYFASDRHAVEVTIEGARTGSSRTLRPDAKGFYEVTNSLDAKALKESGFVEASLMGSSRGVAGYLCDKCGFNGWFKTCGRCGTTQEGPQDAGA